MAIIKSVTVMAAYTENVIACILIGSAKKPQDATMFWFLCRYAEMRCHLTIAALITVHTYIDKDAAICNHGCNVSSKTLNVDTKPVYHLIDMSLGTFHF